ncbi:MAG: radical SAM protein [Thiohalospira sp.]
MDNLLRVENIEFLLTNACNMRCKYCFEGDHVTDKGSVDAETVINYLKNNGARNFYVFGGEPLLKLKELKKVIDFVKTSEDINDHHRQDLLRGLRKITSNGTLINKNNIDLIKEMELSFQISLDGYKEINDINRVFPSGKGTFDAVMKGISLLQENNIPWSIHGVMNMNNALHYLEIIQFLFNTYKKYKGIEEAVNYFNGNFSMFVFEDNFTDDFIDEFFEVLDKTAEWVLFSEDLNELSDDQRSTLFDNVIMRNRVGGVCGIGRGLKTSDEDYNIYPCHRLVVRKDTTLGNMHDSGNLKNVKLYNNLYRVPMRNIYSSGYFIPLQKGGKNETLPWMMLCPATNIETSENPRYTHSSYGILIHELSYYTNYLKNKYFETNQEDNNIQRKVSY